MARTEDTEFQGLRSFLPLRGLRGLRAKSLWIVGVTEAEETTKGTNVTKAEADSHP